MLDRRRMMAGGAGMLAAGLAGPAGGAWAQEAPSEPYDARVRALVDAVNPKVVAWRRDIHEHPELGNRETRTSALVAAHLKRLGMEVRTGVAATGVVGVLRGGRSGPVVALRADMDALPVAEQTGLPFASRVTASYNGATVPVMHACGHDAHTAILMGAAEVLSAMKADLPGTVVFLFQPAEEGPPAGETGGAQRMIAEGALKDPRPDAVFGLHVFPGEPGSLVWRSGPMMAGSDRWEIRLKGRQTHGAQPWSGVDMSSMAADIVTAFNQIAARQMNVAKAPTVLTVAIMKGGMRYNIIPEDFTMAGTLRTFDEAMRTDIKARMAATVASITSRYGASGEVTFGEPNPVVINDPGLSARMRSALARASGGKINPNVDLITGSEDFSYFQRETPGLFYNLGAGFPKGVNHSPYFTVDEAVLPVGVRAQVLTALDFLSGVGA